MPRYSYSVELANPPMRTRQGNLINVQNRPPRIIRLDEESGERQVVVFADVPEEQKAGVAETVRRMMGSSFDESVLQDRPSVKPVPAARPFSSDPVTPAKQTRRSQFRSADPIAAGTFFERCGVVAVAVRVGFAGTGGGAVGAVTASAA